MRVLNTLLLGLGLLAGCSQLPGVGGAQSVKGDGFTCTLPAGWKSAVAPNGHLGIIPSTPNAECSGSIVVSPYIAGATPERMYEVMKKMNESDESVKSFKEVTVSGHKALRVEKAGADGQPTSRNLTYAILGDTQAVMVMVMMTKDVDPAPHYAAIDTMVQSLTLTK